MQLAANSQIAQTSYRLLPGSRHTRWTNVRIRSLLETSPAADLRPGIILHTWRPRDSPPPQPLSASTSLIAVSTMVQLLQITLACTHWAIQPPQQIAAS